MRAFCWSKCFLPARAARARPHTPPCRIRVQTYTTLRSFRARDAVVSHINRSAGRQRAQSSSWRPYLTTSLPSIVHFLAFQTRATLLLHGSRRHVCPAAMHLARPPLQRAESLYSVSPVLHSPPVIAQARRGVSIEPLHRPPPSASACTLTASPCCEPSGAGWPVGRVECRGPGRGLGWPRGRPAG